MDGIGEGCVRFFVLFLARLLFAFRSGLVVLMLGWGLRMVVSRLWGFGLRWWEGEGSPQGVDSVLLRSAESPFCVDEGAFTDRW